MAEEKETEFTFQEKGDNIIWKQDVPNVEMDSKQVLTEIASLEAGIDKVKMTIETFKNQIKTALGGNEKNFKNLKKLKKFEGKMTVIQVSKAKAIYLEVKERCRLEVEKEYTIDEGSTLDSHKHQMFVIYQRKIATCEKAAKELAPKIIQQFYFKEECIIENPFK